MGEFGRESQEQMFGRLLSELRSGNRLFFLKPASTISPLEPKMVIIPSASDEVKYVQEFEDPDKKSKVLSPDDVLSYRGDEAVRVDDIVFQLAEAIKNNSL